MRAKYSLINLLIILQKNKVVGKKAVTDFFSKIDSELCWNPNFSGFAGGVKP